MGKKESTLRNSSETTHESIEVRFENIAVETDEVDVHSKKKEELQLHEARCHDRRVAGLLKHDSWAGKSGADKLEKSITSPALGQGAPHDHFYLVQKLDGIRRFLSETFFNNESDYVMVQVRKHPEDRPADLGFTLHGGGDKPCFPGDPGIFVKHVIPGSVMDGKLRTGDRLLSINGLNATEISVTYARDAVKNAKGTLRLYIKKASKRQQRISDCIRKENQQEIPVFNKQQIEEIEDAFSVFDTNGSGKIKISDVFPLIRSLGHNPLEAAVWVYMNELGLTANRKLKLAEFLRLMAALTMDEDQEGNVVLDSIRVFDTEERGFISTVELREALQCMPGSSQMRDFELKDILKRADPDGKGRIRIKDFRKLLEPSATQS